MLINQQNLQALQTSYSAAFNKPLQEARKDYERIATTIPSSSKYNSYNWMGQIPGIREWIGEREIQNLDNYQYLIANKSFEMTVGVPREDIEDDNFGVYTPMMTMMGEQTADFPNTLVFGSMKKGFQEKCFDGKPFFATDHPVGKETYSNKGTAELSEESYTAARTAMMSIKGDNGKPLNIIPDLLVVSPKNEHKARLILKADQINGTTNVLKDTADLLVRTELAGASESTWYLLCTKRFLKPFIFQQRKKFKFVSMNKEDDTNVFMRKEYLYGVDGRCNAGYGFWQMAFGSDGSVPAQG